MLWKLRMEPGWDISHLCLCWAWDGVTSPTWVPAQLPLCSWEVWELHLVLRQVCGVGGMNYLLHPAVAVKADRQPACVWAPVVPCPPSSLTAAASSASSWGHGACPLPRWHVPKALPRPVCSGPFRSPPPAQIKAGPAPKEGARQPVPQLYPSRTARPCPR